MRDLILFFHDDFAVIRKTGKNTLLENNHVLLLSH